jgi:biopolymer transport protein ExbB/TolQ
MQSFNMIEMWHSMAPLAKAVNVLLAICSIYSLWVIIDRFFSLRSVRAKSVKFVVGLRDQLRSRNLDGAMNLASHMNDSPVARLVRDALTEFKEGGDMLRAKGGHDPEYDPIEAVERVIDRNKEREVADLKRGLGGLASISSAAPFIGLFGTVVGIINAFRSMAATGQGGLGAVSAGISEALFTTAVGLVVAIPAVMTFNYYSTVIERYTVDMNGVGSELVSFIMREGLSQPAAPAQGQYRSQHPGAPGGSVHPSAHPAPYGGSVPPQQPYGSQHPGPVNAHGPTSVHPQVAPSMGSGYPPPGYPPR